MSTRSKPFPLIVTLAVLAACLVLASCWSANANVDATEPLELRTYEVPAQYRDDLRSMLRSALGTDEDRIGRVTSGPGGTLLVVAPARIQSGVEQILNRSFEVPPMSSPVKLSYWVLVGRPVDQEQARVPFSVAGGRSLRRLEPVLRRIAEAQGPMEFALLEHIQLTSMSQERATTSSQHGRIAQLATRRGEQVVADVNIHLAFNRLESEVMLEAGQFLVLGQTGFAGPHEAIFPDASDEDLLVLYYVMAADLES